MSHDTAVKRRFRRIDLDRIALHVVGFLFLNAFISLLEYGRSDTLDIWTPYSMFMDWLIPTLAVFIPILAVRWAARRLGLFDLRWHIGSVIGFGLSILAVMASGVIFFTVLGTELTTFLQPAEVWFLFQYGFAYALGYALFCGIVSATRYGLKHASEGD